MTGHNSPHGCRRWLVWMFVVGTWEYPLIGAEAVPAMGGGYVRYEEPAYLMGAIYGKGERAGDKNVLFNVQRQAKRLGERVEVGRDYTYRTAN